MRNGMKNKLWIPLASVFYLLVFSAYTSPLFPKFMDWDSAIFMMVGKGINEGKQLYTEVFDHKGPVLFWIEALGMRFGRNGVFVAQCIFMTVTVWLMDKIAGYFCSGKKKYAAVAAAMIWLAYPLANGNLSEEYSLPFILAVMHLFLKDWKASQSPRVGHSYLYGVCFGILFFIRVNNAVTICAVILGWAYILMKKKQAKELWKHVLAGLAGIGTAAVPICIYFWQQGALRDMFYATFLFNLRYSGNVSLLKELTDPVIWVRMGILFSPLIAGAVVFFREIRERELRVVMELIAGLNFAALFLGHGYNHYFTVLLPIVLVLFALVPFKRQKREDGEEKQEQENRRQEKQENQEKRKKQEKLQREQERAKGDRERKWRIVERTLTGIVFAGYCVLALRIVVKNVNDYYFDPAVQREYDTVKESFSRIPEQERESVLGYEIPAKYYLMGGVLPCYKYGILQFHWMQNDEQVMEDFLNFVEWQSPLWLISEKDTHNAELKAILSDQYELMWEDGYAEYYRVKEQ